MEKKLVDPKNIDLYRAPVNVDNTTVKVSWTTRQGNQKKRGYPIIQNVPRSNKQ